MDAPKISIIVPIYNVEEYLRESLDSIKAQTFSNWECILVDDGSSDKSPIICDEYSKKDPRFKVVHKSNGGVSSARNAGLASAHAELIGFVDPDDWIEPEMFETLYKLVTENDADIAQIGFKKEYIGRHSTKHFVKGRKVISGKEAFMEFAYDRIPNYLWNKLHRREIITCNFPVGRTFEDVYVYGEWFKNVRRMVLDPTPLYHYRMRKGSIVHGNASKNRYDYFRSCLDTMNMIENQVDKKEKDKKNAYINKAAIKAAKMIARFEDDKKKGDQTIIQISNDLKKYPLPSIGKISMKYWLRAQVLRNHPKAFGTYMRAMHIFDLDMKNREKRYYD